MKQSVSNYKKFVFVFGIFFFMLPCLMMLFNFQVDPNRRYKFSIEVDDLERLASSEDFVLVLPPNYDDRALLKKFISNAVSPEIIVMGGSRVANVQAEFFKRPWNSKLINVAVTEGTIRDYVALWELIEQVGHKPKIIFICIEEQSMNSYSQNSKYLSLYEYYTSFFHEGFSLRHQFLGWTTNLKDLLSMETTIASIKILLHPQIVAGTGEVVPRAGYGRNLLAKTHSFSTLSRINDENLDSKVILSKAQANGLGEVKVFEKWNPDDRTGYVHLEALIRRVKRIGAMPVLIGMPYHPVAYDMIQHNPKAYQNMLLFVRELQKIALDEGVFFYDAIEAHHDDFQNDHFYDGVHLRLKQNHRLFREVDQAAHLGVITD